MGESRHYKRRKIWINSSFQARHTAVIVGVSATILLVLGALYLDTLGEQQRIMGIGETISDVGSPDGSMDEDFNRDLKGEVESDNLVRTLALALIAAVLVASLAYISVRMTFRAAGPVFAVSRMMRAMSEGNMKSVRGLRKKDEFKFLQEDLFALRDSMRKEAERDIDLLTRAGEALRSNGPDSADDLVAELDRTACDKKDCFGLESGD